MLSVTRYLLGVKFPLNNVCLKHFIFSIRQESTICGEQNVTKNGAQVTTESTIQRPWSSASSNVEQEDEMRSAYPLVPTAPQTLD